MVRTIEDAYKIADACEQVKSINLGGTKRQDDSEQISKAIFVNEKDKEYIRALQSRGIEVEIRQLSSDNKQNIDI